MADHAKVRPVPPGTTAGALEVLLLFRFSEDRSWWAG
jgi:hypothetical protein